MSTDKLTDKQARFVQEYMLDMNATQAAIRAGYSARNASKIASQLLGKTRVADAIEAEMEKLAKKHGLDLDYIVERLMTEAEGRGQDTNSKARVTALQTLAKMGGHMLERTEITGKDGGPLQVEISEIAAMIAEASDNGSEGR